MQSEAYWLVCLCFEPSLKILVNDRRDLVIFSLSFEVTSWRRHAFSRNKYICYNGMRAPQIYRINRSVFHRLRERIFMVEYILYYFKCTVNNMYLTKFPKKVRCKATLAPSWPAQAAAGFVVKALGQPDSLPVRRQTETLGHKFIDWRNSEVVNRIFTFPFSESTHCDFDLLKVYLENYT